MWIPLGIQFIEKIDTRIWILSPRCKKQYNATNLARSHKRIPNLHCYSMAFLPLFNGFCLP